MDPNDFEAGDDSDMSSEVLRHVPASSRSTQDLSQLSAFRVVRKSRDVIQISDESSPSPTTNDSLRFPIDKFAHKVTRNNVATSSAPVDREWSADAPVTTLTNERTQLAPEQINHILPFAPSLPRSICSFIGDLTEGLTMLNTQDQFADGQRAESLSHSSPLAQGRMRLPQLPDAQLCEQPLITKYSQKLVSESQPQGSKTASKADAEHTCIGTLTKHHLKILDTGGFSREHDAIRSAFQSLSRPPDAGLVYLLQPSLTGTDVWPDIRQFSRTPSNLTPIAAKFMTSTSQSAVAPWSPSEASSWPQMELRPRQGQWPRRHCSISAGNNPVWPQYHRAPRLLPLEVYAIIMDHLSRDDIKALRLTCKQMEWNVSRFLFRNVVVPFNTEIYGMLRKFSSQPPNMISNGKGKGKHKSSDSPTGSSLIWKNNSSHDVYSGHAMDAFRSFGPYMKRFGMVFEVDEELLSALPRKELLETIKTYWGEYEWPFPDYQRFREIASIEETADEMPLMVHAFSHLEQVEELALSIDAGTGWLRGPDVSLYQRIFNCASPVFQRSFSVPDRRAQAQQDLWMMLKGLNCINEGDDIANSEVHHRLISLTDEAYTVIEVGNIATGLSPPTPVQLELHSVLDFLRGPKELDHLRDSLCCNPQEQSFVSSEQSDYSVPTAIAGILAFENIATDEKVTRTSPLLPNGLTKLQKEWLLETEWAQRAFISSYMLSIMDNQKTFANVHTLTLAKMSTHYLGLLHRNDFWDSLSNLANVTILASGEWQQMYKDEAGYVETREIVPSSQSEYLEDLLTDIIAPRRNIKSLNIGWVSGGEHATGVYGRNQHLLPCPLMPSTWREDMSDTTLLINEMILFPSLEHITLTNCWVIPTVLQLIVQNHCIHAMKKLTLDSVSLTGNMADLADALNLEQYAANSLQSSHTAPVALQRPQTVFAAPLNPPLRLGAAQEVANRLMRMTPEQLSALSATQLANMVTDLAPTVPPATDQAARRSSQVRTHAHNNNPARPRPPQQPPTAAPAPPHRDGSWPAILDSISPGRTSRGLGLVIPHRSILPADSRLETIELKSCGYALVHPPRSVRFDDMETCTSPRSGAAIMRRAGQYKEQMLPANRDAWHGRISQYMSETESALLSDVWGMEMGWPEDKDPLEVFYDGFLPGGRGRFSGVIQWEEQGELDREGW